MSLSRWSDGYGGVIAAGCAAVVLVVAGTWLSREQPIDAVLTTATLQEQTAPTARTTEPTSDTSQDSGPRFDELRRDPAGTTVIAGRASPGSEVIVTANGVEVARGQTDGTGAVAVITELPPSEEAQVIELIEIHIGGEETRSRDTVILTPAPAAAATVVEQPQIPDTPVAEIDTAAKLTDPAPQPAATAPQAPASAVLKSTEAGVQLLNTAPPDAIDSLALDTISYSQAGEVQLAGRAETDTAQVRVYLDNRAIATLPVDAAGRWRGELPQVDEGIYTLRVDQIDGGGDVTSRVETPFKRESAAVLAAAGTGEGPVKAITVQKGATLWAIARDRYGDGLLYVRVFDANSNAIRDPDLIYPGQVFDLPD